MNKRLGEVRAPNSCCLDLMTGGRGVRRARRIFCLPGSEDWRRVGWRRVAQLTVWQLMEQREPVLKFDSSKLTGLRDRGIIWLDGEEKVNAHNPLIEAVGGVRESKEFVNESGWENLPELHIWYIWYSGRKHNQVSFPFWVYKSINYTVVKVVKFKFTNSLHLSFILYWNYTVNFTTSEL